MQFRYLSRIFLIRQALTALHKKHPNFHPLSEGQVHMLYAVSYLQPCTFERLRTFAARYYRTNSHNQVKPLLDCGYITRSPLGYIITPAGLHYLQTLEKYLRSARPDR